MGESGMHSSSGFWGTAGNQEIKSLLRLERPRTLTLAVRGLQKAKSLAKPRTPAVATEPHPPVEKMSFATSIAGPLAAPALKVRNRHHASPRIIGMRIRRWRSAETPARTLQVRQSARRAARPAAAGSRLRVFAAASDEDEERKLTFGASGNASKGYMVRPPARPLSRALRDGGCGTSYC